MMNFLAVLLTIFTVNGESVATMGFSTTTEHYENCEVMVEALEDATEENIQNSDGMFSYSIDCVEFRLPVPKPK